MTPGGSCRTGVPPAGANTRASSLRIENTPFIKHGCKGYVFDPYLTNEFFMTYLSIISICEIDQGSDLGIDHVQVRSGDPKIQPGLAAMPDRNSGEAEAGHHHERAALTGRHNCCDGI